MQHKTILLIEDNPYDEMLAISALKQGESDDDIIVARDGQEALDYLFARGLYAYRNIREIPEIIILDLNLPKTPGLEVLRQIRAHEITRNLPVIIMTSSREERVMMEGYYTGASAYVTKPIDFIQFVEAVRHLGLVWTLSNNVLNSIGKKTKSDILFPMTAKQ